MSRRTAVLFILLLVVAVGLTYHRSPSPSTSLLREPSSTGTATPVVSGIEPLPAPTRPLESRKRSGAAAATAASGGALNGASLEALLAAYSGGREWQLETDDRGQLTRARGSHLAVMLPGAAESAFLRDFTKALGFATEPSWERKSSTTGSFDLVDHMQRQRLSDGTELPVFEAWLRLKGQAQTGASLVNNFLKPITSTVRADVSLTDEEALAIAQREFEAQTGAQFEIVSGLVVYADGAPQEKATRVEVRGPLPHWLLLIGHESRRLVHKQVSSRE